MGSRYIEPFVNAAIHVFREFFNEEAVPGKPFLFNHDEDRFWERSAVIGIGGDSRGVVVVSMSNALAEELTCVLTGRRPEPGSDDVTDVLGEVVNIIAGNAKKGLENYTLTISLPSVVSGPGHRINWPQGIPIIGIPFETGRGPFLITVGLKDIIGGLNA